MSLTYLKSHWRFAACSLSHYQWCPWTNSPGKANAEEWHMRTWRKPLVKNGFHIRVKAWSSKHITKLRFPMEDMIRHGCSRYYMLQYPPATAPIFKHPDLHLLFPTFRIVNVFFWHTKAGRQAAVFPSSSMSRKFRRRNHILSHNYGLPPYVKLHLKIQYGFGKKCFCKDPMAPCWRSPSLPTRMSRWLVAKCPVS